MIRKLGKTLGCLLIAGILVYADQWVKAWVVRSFMSQPSLTVIPKILRFTYVENYGAAFNILMNQRWPLIVFGVVLTLGLVVVLYRSFDRNQRCKAVLVWERVCLVMIVAGAIGNNIDRWTHVYVIDFIQVLFIDFPVFNVADCFIVVGCILMMILIFCEEALERRMEKTDSGTKEIVGEESGDNE